MDWLLFFVSTLMPPCEATPMVWGLGDCCYWESGSFLGMVTARIIGTDEDGARLATSTPIYQLEDGTLIAPECGSWVLR